jgi:hypothetical protein
MCNEEQEKNKEKKKSTTTRTPEPEQDNTGRREISSARISLVYGKRTKLEKKFAYSNITNSNGTEVRFR